MIKQRKVLEIVVPIVDVHRHIDRDFRFTPTPYGSPLRGSTILPFSAATGYRTEDIVFWDEIDSVCCVILSL